MTTAIFLGAGASAAAGAPMQNELFRKYFAGLEQEQCRDGRKRGLAKFFKSVFGIDVAAQQADDEFPTFEEALGILELAELRRESFRNRSSEGETSINIRTTHDNLVSAMALVIEKELRTPKPLHENLLKHLRDERLLPNTIFISTNYDILIDNALRNLDENGIDYGVEFTDSDVPESTNGRHGNRPHLTAMRLYKLHGSLNWLYCPTCNSLTLTPGKKGAINPPQCPVCRSQMTRLIVPPTFYKDMSRVFLSIVWNKAESALRKADHLIFCGYSFPDADMHIKYLLKRIQTNRDGEGLRVTVINNRPHKEDEHDSRPCECQSCSPQAALQRKNEEKLRYRRFLGRDVDYTESSFEDFAENPSSFFR